jgi:flotillin
MEQEAAGIRAKGIAEAEAIEKKAEAQKKMGEASVIDMYLTALPEVVRSAAAPLAQTEKIVMYGEGNSAKVVKDVMMTADQIIQSVEESTGMDIKSAIAGYLGGKASK